MEYTQLAQEKGIIKFDLEEKYITYVHQNIKRNYQNPEEKVQAETFCKLVLYYGYPEKNIRQFISVTMGSSVREADIIVFKDDKLEQPYIVAECKKDEVSEGEFRQAVEQAFSYAQAIAGTVKYVWVTKGNKEEFYKFDKEKNKKTIASEIPFFGETSTRKYRFAKGGFYSEKQRGKEEKIKRINTSF
jgi:type I restriction enzyme M protein